MRFLVLCFSILSIALPANVIANPSYKTIFSRTDHRFDVFKRRFEYEHKKYTGEKVKTNHVIINFVENPNDFCKNCTSPKVGLCKRHYNTREILIKRSYYKTLSSEQQEELMFHELAHCALDWDHVHTTYKGKSISLMGSRMFSDRDFYKRHRRALLKELFTDEIDDIIKGVDSDESN